MKKKFDSLAWVEYIVILIGGVAGLFLGNILVKYVNQDLFRQTVKLILFIGACMLSVAGLLTVTIVVSCVAAVVIIIYAIYVVQSLKQHGHGNDHDQK